MEASNLKKGRLRFPLLPRPREVAPATGFRVEAGPGALLSVIRAYGGATRAQLVETTRLARGTVQNRLDKLTASRFIVAGRPAATTGRPPVVFEFNAAGGYLLTLDIGTAHTRLGLTDLGCRILNVVDLDFDIRIGPERFLAALGEAAAEIIDGIDPRLVLGVGLGLPSPVEWTGLMTRPPESLPGTEWDSVVVADHVRAFLATAGIGPIPVVVDKDANVMAIGEWCTMWPDARDLVALRVGMGVASGILAGGTVVRGAAGIAGDIGHIPDPASDQVCRCGQTGCADVTAAGRAIIAALGRRGAEITRAQDIVALANRNDAEVVDLVRRAGTRLGALVGDVIATLNPRLVVVGGTLAEGNPVLLDQIRTVALSRVHPIAAQSVQIVESTMKSDAGLVGAAHLALREVIDPAAVDAAIERGVVLA